MPLPANIRDFQNSLKEYGLDGYLVTHQSDLNYLTDFPQEGFALLVGRRKVWAMLPMLLKDHFQKSVPGCEILAAVSLLPALRKITREHNLRRVGFDSEKELYARGKSLKDAGCVETPSLLAHLRAVKSRRDLERVEKACAMTAAAFRLLKPNIKPGRSEISVARELESLMTQLGGEGVAFETIVASGPNGALPHHRSSEKIIGKDQAIVIDFGCVYKLYRSDMTRTVFTGKPNGAYAKVYGLVEKSQRAGMLKVRPGVAAGDVDEASRRVIARAGYGKYFIHSTGHGVGIDIHEPPRVAPKSREKLRPGMVVTVEPGIYLPGRFGVRIEDTLAVTSKGSRILTQ
ncbi:MAG: aminopeptidase P family protein [Elusimicrobia bacterium]|nr:aminopeptidase P family protein [Elusimicrobiota bacterium]